jgi:hypothetical protein
MKDLKTLNEITQTALLNGLDRGKRKAVQVLFEDPDVHYVVLMQSGDGTRRNLLTVGPKLEYADLDSLAEVQIDGLRAESFVKVASKQGTRSPFFRTRSSERAEMLDTQVGELQLENKRLNAELVQALKAVNAVEQDRLSLKSKAEYLSDQESELEALQSQLHERETELLRMEEELMDRMNQMVQKEAELEQWEENLFARERRLVDAVKVEGTKKSVDLQRSVESL